MPGAARWAVTAVAEDVPGAGIDWRHVALDALSRVPEGSARVDAVDAFVEIYVGDPFGPSTEGRTAVVVDKADGQAIAIYRERDPERARDERLGGLFA